jgi:hypothetical protein
MRTHTLATRRRLYRLARVLVARHYRRPLTLPVIARTLASSPRQVQRAYEPAANQTHQCQTQHPVRGSCIISDIKLVSRRCSNTAGAAREETRSSHARRAERSDLSSLAGLEALQRITEAVLPHAEWGMVPRVVSASANSVVCGPVRSAYLIAAGHPAAIQSRARSKGSTDDALHHSTRRRSAGFTLASRAAVASPRGRGTSPGSQAELGLRGRTHPASAVHQGRSPHPVHPAAARGVAGGEHHHMNSANEAYTDGAVAQQGAVRHE